MFCVDYFIGNKNPMQVAKLSGSMVNTAISDERTDSLVNDRCHQCRTHSLARISKSEHGKSECF